MTAVSNPVEKRPRRLDDEAENERYVRTTSTTAMQREQAIVRIPTYAFTRVSTYYPRFIASFQTNTMPGLIRPVWDRVSFYLISLLFAPCDKTKNQANATLCYYGVVCKLQ